MSLLDTLGLLLHDPRLALTGLNQFYYGGLRGKEFNPDGVDVFEESWDVLVILDACRHDVFVDAVGDGLGTEPVSSRVSRGSATREWIRGNFADRSLHDVCYVDSNGYYDRLNDEIDAEVFKYILVENDAFGGISAHPDRVTDEAIAAADRFPDKRLVVHYMQPHQPFFGPSAADIEHHPKFPRTVVENDLDRATVERCYRENLELALDAVERLAETLEGRMVVTADHGELLGGPQSPFPGRYYGHPENLYVPELVEVPWLVHETGSRPTVREEQPRRNEVDLSGDELDQKLEDLGYAV